MVPMTNAVAIHVADDALVEERADDRAVMLSTPATTPWRAAAQPLRRR
jgi:hypothetical protein